jgi:hypothetical protein
MNKKLRASHSLFAVALLGCCVLSGCSYVNRFLGLDDDNVYEESIEGVIRYKTGLDVDLTPRSPENKGEPK